MNPKDSHWTDDRLLHEGVWLSEALTRRPLNELIAWAEFVRKVWAAREEQSTETADKQEIIKVWLQDYCGMMRANLGCLSESKIEGLYESILERILDVERYLRDPGAKKPQNLSRGTEA